MYHHNIKPSAPPLPNNDDYINQSIQKTDPYGIPYRQEGETLNDLQIKQQPVCSSSHQYYSYPAYRGNFIPYYEPPQQLPQQPVLHQTEQIRQKNKKKSFISRFFNKLIQFLCCPICCCIYCCMEHF